MSLPEGKELAGLRLLVRHKEHRLTTLERLAFLFYPDNRLRRSCFLKILALVRENPKGIILQDVYKQLLRSKKNPEGLYSAVTISDVWVSMIASGIIERQGRGRPAHFSIRFSKRLQDITDFWSNWVADIEQLGREELATVRARSPAREIQE